VGKRIDELSGLDDAPIGSATTDPRGTDWYRFLTDIEDLLATGHYTWAEQSLRAIQLTVEQTQRVTGGQRAAVSNIERARREDGSRPFGRRRYEGFR
jgi:hypothetical protein